MTEETRIKLIGAGLILATVVIGFVIFSQRFSANKTKKELDIPPVVQTSPSSMPASSPAVAVAKVSSLPKTGFPAGLFVILTSSVALVGWGLRKFPH